MLPGQLVRIHSTEELPTKENGSLGTIWKQRTYDGEDYYLVLVWKSGETCYFHASQLTPTEDNTN